MIDNISFGMPEVTIEVIDNAPRPVPDVCKHFPHGIQDEKHIETCDADFILVGEAPGKNEAELGRPFVGESERKLRDYWRPHGITRSQAYITNVHPFRPAKDSNDISLVKASDIARGSEILRAKLQQAHCGVIVALGNTALQAITEDARTITDWRGSIIRFHRDNEKTAFIIPTFHPAATFRRPILNYFCEADWAKVVRIIKEGYQEPQRHHIIDPDEKDFKEFTDDLRSNEYRGASGIPSLALDIENEYWKTDPGNVTCVGFSYRPDLSLTISTHRRNLGGDIKLIERNWGWVKELCEWDIDKILQNGLYDQYHMVRKAGIWFNRYVWDLIEMDHCLNPNDGGSMEGMEGEADGMKIELRSLAVLTSIYTDQSYYKYMSESSNPDHRLIYNGLDACVTREIFDSLWMKLRAKEML